MERCCLCYSNILIYPTKLPNCQCNIYYHPKCLIIIQKQNINCVICYKPPLINKIVTKIILYAENLLDDIIDSGNCYLIIIYFYICMIFSFCILLPLLIYKNFKN
jgi:hypothetical protein